MIQGLLSFIIYVIIAPLIPAFISHLAYKMIRNSKEEDKIPNIIAGCLALIVLLFFIVLKLKTPFLTVKETIYISSPRTFWMSGCISFICGLLFLVLLQQLAKPYLQRFLIFFLASGGLLSLFFYITIIEIREVFIISTIAFTGGSLCFGMLWPNILKEVISLTFPEFLE